MRKLLVFALTSLVALAVVGCSSTTTTTPNDADAQSVMDSVIPQVFSRWDVNALVAVADPTVYTPERVQRARTFFRELSGSLGPMVKYNKALGKTEITGNGADQTKRASYDALVVFRKGPATIHVVAVKKQGKWMVEDASVQPGRPLLTH